VILVLTQDGYVGVVAIAAGPGDIAVCVRGVRVPMIVRPMAKGCFQLVGRAYFHGFMHGDKWLEELEKAIGYQEIILV
jgi:hypothetical protein